MVGDCSTQPAAPANLLRAHATDLEPVEKAVDIIICRRFKLRGMSWLRQGVGHLLRLRLLRLNGTWHSYWRERFSAALRPWPSAA